MAETSLGMMRDENTKMPGRNDSRTKDRDVNMSFYCCHIVE